MLEILLFIPPFNIITTTKGGKKGFSRNQKVILSRHDMPLANISSGLMFKGKHFMRSISFPIDRTMV